MDTSKLKYTETHEWVSAQARTARIGITDHAQKEISDVVFVELPKTGRALKKGEAAMVIESVKAAFDIYAPVSGKVTAVNDRLKDAPETVNHSPYGDGWLFELEVSDPAELEGLMNEQQYKTSAESAKH